MKRITFKKFAGVRKRGVVPIALPETNLHIDRAVWLTCLVESGGRFGCVINFDGTGMTASIGQAIAVYPRGLGDETKKNDQGPLWRVLNRLNQLNDNIYVGPLAYLNSDLRDIGWFVSPDNKCRSIRTGKLISGQAIRKEFTGSADGVMPVKGQDRKRAERWVKSFHDVFASLSTHDLQLALEKEHFVKRADRVKLRFCKDRSKRLYTLQDLIYEPEHISSITVNQMGSEMDLAMAMYWSHSVNAPGFALKKFCRQVIDKKIKPGETELGRDLAKYIIKKLGKTSFGRWDVNIEHGRYQRTRTHAMKLWPRDLFVGKDAIMPKKF